MSDEFLDELPTLRCGEDGCNSCSAAFKFSCTLVPGDKVADRAVREAKEAAWDEDTQPSAPVFLTDDDYPVDPCMTLEGKYE